MSIPLRKATLAASVLAVFFLLSQTANAQFGKMLSNIPDEANAVIAIDIEALEASPLAVQEKWKEQRRVNRQLDSGAYGPNVLQVLAGAAVKPMKLETEWELTILELENAPNMQELADRLGSNVDEIDGHAAVETPGESFVVRLGEKAAGIFHPAGRQQVARWLRSKKSSAQNDYLKKAIGRLNKKTSIVAALVLQDVSTVDKIRVELADHEAFENKQKDVDPVAKLLASVEGISFDVHVDDSAAAILRIDFGEPADILHNYKDLMVDVLADMGISAREFEEWNARVSGKSWLLQGKLSRQTIDRLMSLADTKFDSKMMGDSADYPSGKQPNDEATQASRLASSYFHDVEDIVAKVGDYKGANANMYANWFRRQAEALNELPTLGVDRELVEFSQKVAVSLRDTADSLRKGTARKVMKQTSVNLSRGGSYGSYYGGTRYGGYGSYRGGGMYNPNAQAAGQATRGTQKRLIGVEQRSQSTAAIYGTMDQVVEEMAQLRDAMTQKYEIEF